MHTKRKEGLLTLVLPMYWAYLNFMVCVIYVLVHFEAVQKRLERILLTWEMLFHLAMYNGLLNVICVVIFSLYWSCMYDFWYRMGLLVGCWVGSILEYHNGLSGLDGHWTDCQVCFRLCLA